jgi:hypothetical protein
LLALTSQKSAAEAQQTDFRVSTSEKETIMAEKSPINGEKNHEERGPASTDHDMADAETTVVDYFPLTEECHHYTRRSDVDWDIQKQVTLLYTGPNSNFRPGTGLNVTAYFRSTMRAYT